MTRSRSSGSFAWIALVLLAACAPSTRLTYLDSFLRHLPGPRTKTTDLERQIQWMSLALVGREDRIPPLLYDTPDPSLASAMRRHPRDCHALTRNEAIVDPLAEIVDRAAQAQVVIVNEAHHTPQGRAFVGDVLAALRPLGFTVYAAESFSPTIGRNGPRHPRITDGGYVNEPTFGDVMRRARDLGYALVSYDQSGPSTSRDPINEREEIGASNLVKRIFATDPHARVVIHAGYSHARKLEDDGVRWLALRLQQ